MAHSRTSTTKIQHQKFTINAHQQNSPSKIHHQKFTSKFTMLFILSPENSPCGFWNSPIGRRGGEQHCPQHGEFSFTIWTVWIIYCFFKKEKKNNWNSPQNPPCWKWLRQQPRQMVRKWALVMVVPNTKSTRPNALNCPQSSPHWCIQGSLQGLLSRRPEFKVFTAITQSGAKRSGSGSRAVGEGWGRWQGPKSGPGPKSRGQGQSRGRWRTRTRGRHCGRKGPPEGKYHGVHQSC